MKIRRLPQRICLGMAACMIANSLLAQGFTGGNRGVRINIGGTARMTSPTIAGSFGSSSQSGTNAGNRMAPQANAGVGNDAMGNSFPSMYGGMKPSVQVARPNIGIGVSRPAVTPADPSGGTYQFPGATDRLTPGYQGWDYPNRRPVPNTGGLYGRRIIVNQPQPPTRPWPDRPTTRPTPPFDRPIGRPTNPYPININQIVINNYYFNNSLGWVTLGSTDYYQLNGLWQNQIYGLNNWTTAYPVRVQYWNSWGNNVLHHWQWYPYHQVWFTGDWWYGHQNGICKWHYYNQFNQYPWAYWWSYPTWNNVGTWFQWNAPANVWTNPVFYDYGNGGNVIFRNNSVFINNQRIATEAQFAQSAALLATIDWSQYNLDERNADWLPLGTFAVSSSERDLEPNRVLQLAVDRNGIVAGTLYNFRADSTQAIQGRVDPQTQRVAFRFSGSSTAIGETGLYNLTQPSAPMLIHYGDKRVERFNLVRLEQPQSDDF